MSLTQTTKAIKEMKDILMSTKELVGPDVFYHDLRPWLMRADADAWGRKWTWEVPAIDAYLGIEEDESKSSFLARVRIYMDHKYDEFLQGLGSENKFIRSFVKEKAKKQGTNSPIVVAYNAAIQVLKCFRDAHLIIVTLYVIVPLRKNTSNSDKRIQISGIEIGSVRGEAGADSSYEKACGTNDEQTGEAALDGDEGAQLMKFLTRSRDQTDHTALE
ncbi:hypothetical protein GGI43DRAFT_427616 [Trichoderma evansii]